MFLRQITVRGYRAAATSELICQLPGRFSVLVGPNNGGKTTLLDAAYLAHPHRFPSVPRPTAATLGPHPRSIDIAYAFEGGHTDEGPLGKALRAEALAAPHWTRFLERSLGAVRATGIVDGHYQDSTRLVYLPANRDPVDELARREAQILVELLRAEQERLHGKRNLASLRHLATNLLADLVQHEIVASVENRVSTLMGELTSGTSTHHGFVGSQDVDDAFLARVLEFLLATINDRGLAQRLEVSGLGYVNLLQLAVTLAAIPDPAAAAELPSADDEQQLLEAAGQEAEAIEDSFFAGLLHTTVIIEEPEAHLHPQLLHGLMAYLRRTVASRPELQIIVSTHSGDLVSGCHPADLVIVRQIPDGTRRARSIAGIPLTPAAKGRMLRMADLHLDSVRSVSLFAPRVLLVEGITDAILARTFALAWADGDPSKAAFVEALPIIAMGAVPGEWTGQLLATPGHELCDRVAILRDSDNRTDPTPAPPAWISGYDTGTIQVLLSHPTLEPTLVTGNEAAVAAALTASGIALEDVTPATVDDTFRTDTNRKKKAQFAYELAAEIRTALDNGVAVQVPDAIGAALDFLIADPPEPDDGPVGAPPADG